ncbi:MAG: shikimate dehydrogenase [Gammaproteobacteria bacterium]|nr:shikimate dehydrogenase [Gammaproteobacteria bacterium]
MGNPIAHSKSPQIHAAFAAQTGQQLYYQAVLVDEGGFLSALDEFQQQGGKGLNITVPFKEDAWKASRHRTGRADRAHAVNTIWFGDNGRRHGDTTDGTGLVRDLTVNHEIVISGKDVLILGAGGAVRGILDPLFDEQPARVVIANRTLSRAEQLSRTFSDRGDIKACGFDALKGKQFHIIINGTSASLQRVVPPLPDGLLAASACCYDMMYSTADTVFITWAKSQNAAKVFDGTGMLVEQAAESFYLWRGIRPDTKPVIEMLRVNLAT